MGTISSGVGLISGINIEEVVTQLMAIEARPRQQLETRVEEITNQQTALMKIQALVMAVQISSAGFNKDFIFQQKTVASGNEDVITATADKFATEGTYNFTVKQLAGAHHFVSRGYSSLDSGIGSGTISFEIGQGQLAKPTELSLINGRQGFQRGKISITDRAGNTSDIDLTTALTVQDVIDEINKNTTVNVTASVYRDSLVISDQSGQSGNLIVADIGSGHTAADLGIRNDVAGSVTDDKIIGRDILYITNDTRLNSLNDGNGIRGLNSPMEDIKFTLTDGTAISVDLKDKLSETIGDDAKSTTLRALNSGAGVRMGTFRITDQNGRFVDVELSDLGSDATVGQLKTHIETVAQDKGMDISVAFGSLDHLKITDNSEGTGDERRSHFIIEDIDGHAAADLGIVDDVAGSNINGDQVWFMESIGDVINAVNNHWENIFGDMVLAIDATGGGITVTDNTGPSGEVTIEALNGSLAAEDLGLLELDDNATGRRLIAGLNTVMLRTLNGGSGGDPGADDYGLNRITGGESLLLKDRDSGTAVAVDLTDVFTVQDLIDAINQAGSNITAAINELGNGIILTDTSSGTGNLEISGELARKIGIEVNDAVSGIDSGNLQLQYISEAAILDDLRQGQGIHKGKFTITDSTGQTATVDLARDDIKTLEDVIDEINSRGTNIRARINDTGDGLLLYDDSEGENVSAFTVTEQGGSTAGDLGILGTAQKGTDGEYYLDGSYEFKLEVGGGDSIEDIVSKINAAEMGLNASIINDGSNYLISFNSQISGRVGNVYLDGGSTNLTTDTLTVGRDAVVFLGDDSDEHPLLISSSTNTIKDAIKGTTLELHSTSDEPVEISVEQDLEAVTGQINSFVEAYNALMDELAEVSKFDPDTYERGILFADRIISSVRSSIQSMIHRAMPGDGAINRLSQIGITFAPFGNELIPDAEGKNVSYAVARTPKLSFDEAKFRTVFADDPDGVAEFFTRAEVGMGDFIANRLDRLAGDSGSTIKNRLSAMQSRQSLFEKRMESLDKLLDAKELRLYKEFYAMEQALASLQSQQNALTSLSSMTSAYNTLKK